MRSGERVAFPSSSPLVERQDLDLLLDVVDGLVIIGGGDLDPTVYGHHPHPETRSIDAERDAFDARALEQVIERSLPALGICRALQVLNAMHGGTLHQHLPDHEVNDKPEDTAHVVTVEAGSRLARIVGTGELGVNSLHHQGIDRLGEGLRATAHSPEGLVEAVELERQRAPGRCPVAPGASPTARNSSRSSRISSLARALTLASHTGRARGPENPPHRSMWHRCRAVNRRVHRRGMERGREGRQLLYEAKRATPRRRRRSLNYGPA